MDSSPTPFPPEQLHPPPGRPPRRDVGGRAAQKLGELDSARIGWPLEPHVADGARGWLGEKQGRRVRKDGAVGKADADAVLLRLHEGELVAQPVAEVPAVGPDVLDGLGHGSPHRGPGSLGKLLNARRKALEQLFWPGLHLRPALPGHRRLALHFLSAGRP